jgi:hypothetical protein
MCDISKRDFRVALERATQTGRNKSSSFFGDLGLQAKVNVRMDWCTALVLKILSTIRVK